MATPWTLNELHTALAEHYRNYRGVTAPVSRFTIEMWNAIEKMEQSKNGRR